jgi:hypothetical protein
VRISGCWRRGAIAFRIERALPVLLVGTLLWTMCAAPAYPQTDKQQAKPLPVLTNVTIDLFRMLEWEPTDNFFRSASPIRILFEFTDPITGEKSITTLEAEDVEGSPTSEIKVRGKLTLTRAEGVLTGKQLQFSPGERTGTVMNAQTRIANLSLSGKRVDLLPGQTLKAFGGSFTTCIHGRPDYRITAREVEVQGERQKVKARDVTIWLGGTRLISLPFFEKSFRRTVQNPIPLPGYSKEEGIQFRFRNELLSTPRLLWDYDLRLSLRRTPQGSITYESDLRSPKPDDPPPSSRRIFADDPQRTALESNPALLASSTDLPENRPRASFYAQASSSEFVYNRKRSDLRISRLPEVGLSLRNLLNRPAAPETPPGSLPDAQSAFGRGFLSPSLWLINAEAGLAYIRESPSRTESVRLGGRMDATSPLFQISGPIYVRYGATTWVNLYEGGKRYTLFAPEVETDLLLRPNTLIGAAYRYQHAFGTTPFLFDRLDVRHELSLRYSFIGGYWGYELRVKYDMERKRAYDTLLSIRRRFDCMEIGVSYQARSQGLGVIFNLLPGALENLGRQE